MKPAQAYFKQQAWKPFPFQQEVWKSVADGNSGLLHATTGSGKTYAVWLAALNRFVPPLLAGEGVWQSVAGASSTCDKAKHAKVTEGLAPSAATPLSAPQTSPLPVGETKAKSRRKPSAPPLTVLWITPMRALAADTERALQAPLTALELPWTVGVRSGDTTSSQRAKQSRQLPTVLITTPESLSLLLSRADASTLFAHLGMVVVDEWHELIANKRGVQLQLALARLRQWQPALITWGLSATLGNLPHALEVLVPQGGGQLVQGSLSKTLLIDTLLPKGIERFPWAGHLGLRLLPLVVDELEHSATALVFTNTRSQSELWYRALLEARPDWAGLIALHHGSLDRAVRDWVERALKDGSLKAVVCTSSLDLGVDFLPVERVLQIGSPKGVARLMQRAGRSGHAPGRASRLTLVPTNSLEIIEAVAAQDAIAARQIEPRQSPEQPFDVLVQHLVTVALGGGFKAEALYPEVRSSYAYRNLSAADWQWALDFVRHGGSSLAAYPDYRRVVPDDTGLWQVPDAQLARRHRLSIGTIVSDASMVLKFVSRGGKALGVVEESFIARLKPGDHLLFAGRTLELVRVHEMIAYVRPGKGKQPAVPRWAGGRMPLSSELASAVVARMDAAARGVFEGPEMQAVKPLLEVQQRWSALPTTHILLAETFNSREGWHLFLYPYAGRNVHQGLASLLSWRLGQQQPRSFSIAINDYGFELLSPVEIDWPQALTAALFSTDNLLADVFASLNAGELAQRRFREIARIAGLVFQGMPGAPKSTRQVQASSKLFFDVFRQYDPGNPLLSQSQQEVLGQELEVERLRATLTQMQAQTLQWQALQRPSPLAFPLLVERLRESASTEKLADRIARMVADLEKAAGGEAYVPPDAAADRGRFEGIAPPAPPARRERRTGRKPRR